MRIYNATEEEIDKALKRINKKYDGNIIYDNFEKKGNIFQVRLRVKDSSGKGARRGPSGRRTIHACWHAHGDFFDALFDINPDIYVRAQGRRIDINQGNWVDWNIGSMVEPLMYSEACECWEWRR